MRFDLVEATGQIKHRKVLCISQVVQNVCDIGQGVGIPDYLFVEGSEINNNSPLLLSRSIEFFFNIPKWGIVRGFRVANNPTIVLPFGL